VAKKVRRQSGRVQAEVQAQRPRRVVVSATSGCIVSVILAALHRYFGTTTPSQAATTAVVSAAIFLASYFIVRRVSPKQGDKPIVGLVVSIAIAIPVFVVAFIGLGYEIPEMADFGALYILGVWLGSSEASQRAR